MLTHETVRRVVEERGYTILPGTQKVTPIKSPLAEHPAYINNKGGDAASTLILHPALQDRREALLAVKGVHTGADAWYHNSNMRRFPERLHRGKNPTRYGIPFGFDSERSLNAFLDVLEGRDTTLVGDPLSDIAAAERELAGCNATERDALVKARVGQGPFRDSLISYWEKCAVTGCSLLPVLRASHIKPWRSADNSERLDPFNGLLLAPNLDALFDRGLITFDSDGRLVMAAQMIASSATLLGLTPGMRLSSIDPRHLPYLAWHRAHVFLK